MQNQLFNLLTFIAAFIFAAVIVYFGTSIDIQIIAAFLISVILTPILAYYALFFVLKSKFNYLCVPLHFTRILNLQIVDPLLN
ncbi:hypothetical protein SHI21_08635 [Bacteriovorax sp. PP10]|uniref:Uncharacterized protein n=1 Tax=Bacteriovorax antarcticus TaxID=3088717 RepID=A0ABU5VTE7_9BACT|nr:hypothetical protein [Bacteriovorax sp. PP10]MEA9356266.1 hypothetical protein [Bacteriovorax sp. PP10]